MNDHNYIQKTEKLLQQIKDISSLSLEQASSIYQDLQDVIRFHNQKYYQEDAPVISDVDYDHLFTALKNIEKKYPQLLSPDSPTQKLAISTQSTFAEVAHLIPMLSLDNTYNEEDILEFEKRIRNILKTDDVIEYIVELKFDGIGIALVYENDKLIRGATRGDGIHGEDITENIKTIRSIPHTIPLSQKGVQKMEVRGEIIMPKKSFESLNKKREKQGEPLFANPRNAAGGSLRQLDPSITKQRDLDCFLYHLSFLDNEIKKPLTQENALNYMKQLHLPVSAEYKICRGVEDIIQYVKEIEQKRHSFPFEIDGMVIKVNDFSLQEKLGYTEHHPRWAVAYKFKAFQAETKLVNITLQVGRTGVITPVAELEPVNIGGVMVKRASLYNNDYIQEHDLRVGDRVMVERAGDVIPRVAKALINKRTGKEKQVSLLHQKCPSCGSDIIQMLGEVALRCTNLQCPAQREERITHFVSKNAMDIEGMGTRLVQLFIEKGFLKSMADIYRLGSYETKQKLLFMEGFGQKSVDNLLSSIEKSKQQPLWRLVHGLGIRNVGKKTAKTLASASNVETIWDIFDMKEEELQQLAEIGPIVAESIKDYYTEENKQLIKELEEMGVNIKAEKKEEESRDLEGKMFVLTGELESMSREEASEKIESLGGKTSSSVSKNTSFLIIGKNPGSKLIKAKELGVAVIEEGEFLRMMGGGKEEQTLF